MQTYCIVGGHLGLVKFHQIINQDTDGFLVLDIGAHVIG